MFTFEIEQDTDTVKLPEITRPKDDVEERIKLPGDNEVKKVIQAISDRHVSVLSYVILSGSTTAVETISDLVVRIFENDNTEVRFNKVIILVE